MSNPWYTKLFAALPGQKVRSGALRTEYTSLQTAFDNLDIDIAAETARVNTELQRAIKLPAAPAPGDQVLADAATRAGKVLGFDVSGNVTLLSGLASAFGGLANAVVDFLTGANIAGAATINLNAATGNRVHITGAGWNCTAVTLTNGPRTVIFDGIGTLTHHATNNNLPGAASIITAAGDRAIYESDGTKVYCVAYQRANGRAVVGGVTRVARTANTILGNPDSGKLIDVTSGTFTQTFDACATLGADWSCYYINTGTGDVTFDPNGAETIDNLASFIMYPGEARLIQCDGAALRTVLLQGFKRKFTANGTFTKPPGYSMFGVDVISGGGGGSTNRGGGGGGRVITSIPASAMAATEAITVSTGSAGSATTTCVAAGNSSIGTLITVVGANSNASTDSGSGGYLTGTASTPATSFYGAAGSNGNQAGGSAEWGGASGGYNTVTANSGRGGSSMFGGGGGGGTGNAIQQAGGTSGTITAGGGGAANAAGAGTAGAAATSDIYCGSGGGCGSTTGGDGGIPGGGGGGGGSGAGGAGARGEVRIWGIV